MGSEVIVHLVHALNDRAVAAVVRVVADEMVHAGTDATVMARHVIPGAPRPDLASVFDLGGGSTRAVTLLPRLVAALRGIGADAVFAHGAASARAAVAAGRLISPRPRVVTVTHNHYSSYGWDARRLRRVVDDRALRWADAVTGVSPGVAADLRAVFPAVAGRVSTLPAPLTRATRVRQLAAEPVQHPWLDGRSLFVSVSHVHPRKDQMTLVRALARIPVRTPQAAPHLLLIGAATGSYADGVRALVAELGLTDRVELLGAVANPLPYVARATALALTSRNEGMGISILEALALGTPVLTTDAPSGPRWLLEDGRHGLVVPVGDVAAVADALQRLAIDPALRARLAASGRRRVHAFFPSVIAKRYLELLRALPDTIADPYATPLQASASLSTSVVA